MIATPAVNTPDTPFFFGKVRGAVLFAVLMAVWAWPATIARADTTPTVAVSASLRFAMADLQSAFQRETGMTIRISYGASGNLAQQLERGAPFEVFLSANEAYVARLTEKGLTKNGGDVFALGMLVLIVPKALAAPLPADATAISILTGGNLDAIALANPRHAPYGQAAERFLSVLGRQGAAPVKNLRKLTGENVSQAAYFVLGGGRTGGLVARSLAWAPAIREKVRIFRIPPAMHGPIRHRMVLMKNAGTTASEFYSFLTSPVAQEILLRYGFGIYGAAEK